MAKAYDKYEKARADAAMKRDAALVDYRKALMEAQNEVRRRFADVVRKADKAHNEKCESAYEIYLKEFDAEQLVRRAKAAK